MRRRLEWVDKLLATPSGPQKIVNVHIDEKCFYAFKLGRTLYLPPGVNADRLPVTSKTQIPNVMFLAAVAEPR
jgi:hypothetical protein